MHPFVEGMMMMRKSKLILMSAMVAAGGALYAADAGCDPTKLEFKLLATRRFMLDNEVMLSEFVPGESARPSLQNPLMPYCAAPLPKLAYGKGAVTFSAPAGAAAEGVLFVGAFHPGVHFSADVQSLSEGSAAVLCIAPYDGSFRACVRAEPGKPVAFEQSFEGKKLDAKLDNPQIVPAPPFRLSAVVAGPTILIAVRKDGDVRYLGSVALVEDPDIRRRDFAGWLKCAAGASLPPGGTASLTRAAVTLTAGVGQADFRIVTDGPSCRPYMENGRIFCTFSARAGLKYTKSVASFNPSVFDFRMEGILLTSYGDDDPLLRNDGVGHVFRDSDGIWKAIAVGWSTTKHDLSPGSRKGSGLVACESRENPLHGIHVLRAKPLVVGDGLKSEDPYTTFDPTTNKWRLATSSFTGKGLRACLWESDRWDGPYAQIAGPVPFDSTGCEIMDFGGRTYVMTANAKRKRPVYEYPSLQYVGELRLDFEPYNEECSNGRIFTAFAEMPEGYPYRYILLTMDRQNFPGMPKPNWTYGAMYLYGANP